MARIKLKLPHHAYSIHIEPGLLGRLGQLVRSVAPHAQAALVSDTTILGHYGETTIQSLCSVGYKVCSCKVKPGEDQKTLQTTRVLYDKLLEQHLERRSPMIALGGGVVGDMAGFVAATYLRGLPFVQCPTTLLAMVDASVGGKVAVNLPQGKNLVGSFYQPQLVVIDTDTLTTLPPRQLRCGLAECIKHAMIRDADLFQWIENRIEAILSLDPETMVELVERNVRIKSNVVMADEKENNVRAELNFGHTFGHAIEAITQYGHDGSYQHGECVALGMVAASHLASSLGLCESSVINRLVKLLQAVGLPTSATNLPIDQLLDTMRLDKKVECGQIQLILPKQIGQASIVPDVPESSIRSAWASLESKP